MIYVTVEKVTHLLRVPKVQNNQRLQCSLSEHIVHALTDNKDIVKAELHQIKGNNTITVANSLYHAYAVALYNMF